VKHTNGYVISKTPYRISFFGGGTDFPQWYKKNNGVVLSTTIDKYSYISCRNIQNFFDYKYKIVYSKVEEKKLLSEIEHPAVREVLHFLNVKNGLQINHDGDLPSRSGIGSSSAFTVGLLNALCALYDKNISKENLYLYSIFIEQKMIQEAVGSQDQVAVSIGGFNEIHFLKDGGFLQKNEIIVNELHTFDKNELNDNLLLFFTGKTRIASEIEKVKIEIIEEKENYYRDIYDLTLSAIHELKKGNIDNFGKYLHNYWIIKKELSTNVSNEEIDEIYDIAIRSGAEGGKLLGSGNGGFMLFYVKDKKAKKKVLHALKKLLYVPFKFENSGSTIIYREGS